MIFRRIQQATERASVVLTLGSIPLHAIFRAQLAEVSFDNGRVGAVRQSALVTTSTKILLASRDESIIDTRRSLAAGHDRGRTERREQSESRENFEMHHVEELNSNCV